ncbi:hypothetical protein H6F75_16860 [Nodosilinea sp. FACHB-131]|uniref:hypothetical protein n=1 Tax=Cyanophyceae TaxID=3028117 RepID=UPI001684F7AA|nr:hypothetical protein [Nodosilinea sp. FACHB-131]MBD1875156.1 hypothetical protein [Nodosilinea sp. FACHB-131]
MNKVGRLPQGRDFERLLVVGVLPLSLVGMQDPLTRQRYTNLLDPTLSAHAPGPRL